MSYGKRDIWNRVLTEESRDIKTTQKKDVGHQKIWKKLTHLLHNVRREDSGSKGSAEDGGEFLVQTSDSHLLKVPVRVDDCLSCLLGLCLTLLKHRKKRRDQNVADFDFLCTWLREDRGRYFLKILKVSKACFTLMERKGAFLRSSTIINQEPRNVS